MRLRTRAAVVASAPFAWFAVKFTAAVLMNDPPGPLSTPPPTPKSAMPPESPAHTTANPAGASRGSSLAVTAAGGITVATDTAFSSLPPPAATFAIFDWQSAFV